MERIIENTSYTQEELMRWHENHDRMPLDHCRYNAKASHLLVELNNITMYRSLDPEDVDRKIDMLVEILCRGIEFKDNY